MNSPAWNPTASLTGFSPVSRDRIWSYTPGRIIGLTGWITSGRVPGLRFWVATLKRASTIRTGASPFGRVILPFMTGPCVKKVTGNCPSAPGTIAAVGDNFLRA